MVKIDTFELMSKKSHLFFAWKIGKSEIFSDEIENFCDRRPIHVPQTSNQIDAARLDT